MEHTSTLSETQGSKAPGAAYPRRVRWGRGGNVTLTKIRSVTNRCGRCRHKRQGDSRCRRLHTRVKLRNLSKHVHRCSIKT